VSDATASAGGRLGRYHLVEPIGGGPNGEVYRAKVYGVAGFERQFAVKKFFPHVALNSRYAQALSAAARAYGSLEHPRIARLAEFGVSGGHTFTATELSPGIDAARLLSETLAAGGAIPAGSALALVSQAARAVGYAHGRGISHLGVAPTNLIVSADGEVKVSDVGVLGACLPDRPAHDGRFTTRVHYLAPEQLTSEPASAATDVFALGLIAYELVTGERAFVGHTAEDVAQAILTGQPREPQLPRPIMRVLQRCLARSPYERFPDARALADALDAAVRVSPVPGTRGEIADLATAAIRRIAELNEQQLSGALSLNLPSAGRMDTVADRPNEHEAATLPFQREPDSTFPELAARQPATTMQGMAPPPIAVPQGVAPPPVPPTAPLNPAMTLQGVAPIRPPPVRHPTGALPPPIPRAVGGKADGTGPTPQPPAMGPMPSAPTAIGPPPIAGPGSSGRLPPIPDRFATSEPTNDAHARMDTGVPVPRMDTGEPVPPPFPPPMPVMPGTPMDGLPAMGRPPSAYDGFQVMPGSTGPLPPVTSTTHIARPKSGSRKWVIALVAIVATAGGVIAGWQLLDGGGKSADGGGTGTGTAVAAGTGTAAETGSAAGTGPGTGAGTGTGSAAGTGPGTGAGTGTGSAAGTGTGTGSGTAVAASDAAPLVAVADAAPATTMDAAQVAVATIDAATPPDAGTTVAVGTSDKLEIGSTPAGARVFIDGSDQGQTPVTIAGTTDRHTLALVLAGHEPYIAEIDGHGTLSFELKEVTPPSGPAGIKVKCKEKGRYVVYLDGKATGQLCPTERLGVEMGEHLVEIYDLVTETKRQYTANVKETRLSFRIRLD
jgi:eukaryotic-like serine/threonine-protein kinase